MAVPVSAQLGTFLLSLLCGGAFALFYDLFAPLRRRFSSRAVTALLDGAYCLLIAGLLFLFILRPGEGRPRIYLLAGIALGAVAYWSFPAAFFRPVWGFWLDCILLAFTFLDAPRRFLRDLWQKAKKIRKRLFYFGSKYVTILSCKPWKTKETRQWRKKRPPRRKKV